MLGYGTVFTALPNRRITFTKYEIWNIIEEHVSEDFFGHTAKYLFSSVVPNSVMY